MEAVEKTARVAQRAHTASSLIFNPTAAPTNTFCASKPPTPTSLDTRKGPSLSPSIPPIDRDPAEFVFSPSYARQPTRSSRRPATHHRDVTDSPPRQTRGTHPTLLDPQVPSLGFC